MYDPLRDRLVIYGGYDYQGGHNVYPLTVPLSGSPAWLSLGPAGGPVSYSASVAAVYDPVYDRMVLFGGEIAHNKVLGILWGGESGTEEGEIAGSPATFALGSPVPNPCNPLTRIKYEVPARGGHVCLAVFDVQGRRIRSLLDQDEAGGSRQVTWSGENDAGAAVPSGIYFCRMEAEGFVATEKVVMVR